MAISFKEWKADFLSKKDRKDMVGDFFEDIEGSPLYSYKMTSDEFLSLRDCLTNNLKTYLSIYSINKICQKLAYFSPLFAFVS